MLQTYQGYFQNGHFISPEITSIPEGVEVYLTVTNRKPKIAKYRAKKADKVKETDNKFLSIFAAAEKAENTLSDTDWNEFENLRSKTNLSRRIEL